MNLLDADTRLRKLGHPLITTADAAACLRVSAINASNIMRRLAAAGRVRHILRNRWLVSEEFDPLTVPEHLSSPWPSYISLHSALYHHGLISQMPVVTYAITLARTQRYETSLGVFSLHHINPEFFFGFELLGQSGVKMASAEKALVDYLYLSPGRSRLFRALPELELPRTFSKQKISEIISKIPSRRRRSLVQAKLATLF